MSQIIEPRNPNKPIAGEAKQDNGRDMTDHQESLRWVQRIRKLIGSNNRTDWVTRMILNETGELTSTTEYICCHAIIDRYRNNEPLPDEVDGGVWSSVGAEELCNPQSRMAVEDALATMRDRDLIQPVHLPEADSVYWRLTKKGARVRDILSDRLTDEIMELSVRYGRKDLLESL